MTRRLFDLGVVSALLPVAIPLLLTAALTIFLASPGKVFYRAPRVGKDGRVFMMFKLRTMRALVTGRRSAITAHNDPRIIPTANWVRRFRIDELPQIYNVLKGDMSIVGTRPRDPSIFRQADTPLYRELLRNRPGLTCPGSLYNYLHAEQTLVDYAEAERTYVRQVLPVILALDVMHMREASVGKDLRLVLRTLAVIVGIVHTPRHHSEYDRADRYLYAMGGNTADAMPGGGDGC